MLRVLWFTMATLAITSCSSTTLAIQEDSHIPESSLEQAYAYVDGCVERKSKALINSDVRYTNNGGIIPERDEAILEVCTDNMFILFAESEYSVVESGKNGVPHVICAGSADKVEHCLNG